MKKIKKTIQGVLALGLLAQVHAADEAPKQEVHLEEAIQGKENTQVGKALNTEVEADKKEKLSASAQAGPAQMSLADALRKAHTNHPEMQSKKYSVDQMENKVYR